MEIIDIKDRGLKFHIETYGCQMNEHDSEKIGGILSEMGCSRAEDMENADIILFNTCCVRENAELKLFGNVGALKNRKKKNPELIIGVCGCMMQEEGMAKKLASTFPFIDIIFGTNSMQELPQMIYAAAEFKERTIISGKAFGDIIEDIPVRRNAPPLSYVSIMQGCNNFCSYCIVPYVRGRERSRKPEDILREVSHLANSGYKEVMLLGQNVNSYGLGTETSFPKLLARVAKESGIERIRFMTSHPKDISEELIEVMATNDNICKQLHLPVQSGSDRILALMNRRYTRDNYLKWIEKTKKAMPDCALSTDIIVGFPGETDEEFEDTMSLMEEVRYDAAYMFVYSRRKGTSAAEMPDQIPDEIKKQRITRLVNRQNDIVYENNLLKVGTIQKVLIEGRSKRSAEDVCGRTDCGRMVNIPCSEDITGRIVDVKITLAKRSTLMGELL